MTYPKINYVIAAWSGVRRDGGNGLRYLRKQISQLDLLDHSLSQVTVMVPHNPDEPSDFSAYVAALAEKPGFVIVRCKNEGVSYGSWSRAYEKWRTAFDFYIFMEDDYHFVEDHFDRTLVTMLKGHGYLCGFVSEKDGVQWPGNAIGIARSEVLEKVRQVYGQLPFDRQAAGGRYTEANGQVEWGLAFQRAGYTIADITDQYACLHWYWQHRECRLIPGQPKSNSRFLFVPFQAPRNSAFLPFKGRYAGREGVLIATGPSLSAYDYAEINGYRIVVGVNSMIAELRSFADITNEHPDYYFCGHTDQRSAAYLDLVKTTRSTCFGYTRVDGATSENWLSDRRALDLGVLPFELTTRIEFHNDLARQPLVDHAINFSALQFMIWIGLRTIYLVGCDVTSIVSYRDPAVDPHRSTEKMLEVWRAFQAHALRNGVRVVSVNPIGLKGMFEERV